MDRQEMTGRGRIGFKLTPKPTDVRIHCSGGWIAIIAPGGIQDCVPGQWTIVILQEEQQKVILGTGNVYYLAATHYLSAADIDRHISETNYMVSDVTRSVMKNRVDRTKILVHARRLLWVVDHNYIIHLRHAPSSVQSVTIGQSPFGARNQSDFSNLRHAFSTAFTFLTFIV